jgi:hypothetical protein
MTQSRFAPVDPILSRWALKNGQTWLTNYQDSEVRTVLLPMTGTESVQIWIDPPRAGVAAIHVAYNGKKPNRKMRQESYPTERLEQGLDEALTIAISWMNEPNAQD